MLCASRTRPLAPRAPRRRQVVSETLDSVHGTADEHKTLEAAAAEGVSRRSAAGGDGRICRCGLPPNCISVSRELAGRIRRRGGWPPVRPEQQPRGGTGDTRGPSASSRCRRAAASQQAGVGGETGGKSQSGRMSRAWTTRAETTPPCCDTPQHAGLPYAVRRAAAAVDGPPGT